MRIRGSEVVISAKELNKILEFAVEEGCKTCEFHPMCFFAADCITNDFKYYLEKNQKSDWQIALTVLLYKCQEEESTCGTLKKLFPRQISNKPLDIYTIV